MKTSSQTLHHRRRGKSIPVVEKRLIDVVSGPDELPSLVAEHEGVVSDLKEDFEDVVVGEGEGAFGPEPFDGRHASGEDFLLLEIQEIHVQSFQFRRFHEHFRDVALDPVLLHLHPFEERARDQSHLGGGGTGRAWSKRKF